MNLAATLVDDCAALLQSACARNLSVELQHAGPGGAYNRARSRLLGVDSLRVLLDRLHGAVDPAAFVAGKEVTVCFQSHDQWYQFESVIIDTRCRLQVNQHMNTLGVSILRPAHIRVQQRREAFRVSVTHLPLIAVDLHDAAEEPSGACRTDCRRVRGVLHNVSVDGVAILFDARQCQLKPGERLFIRWRMPGDQAEMMYLAETRHSRTIRERDTHIAGMRFLRWNEPDYVRQFARLSKFIVEAQRRKGRLAT